jgi:hypothetical protein
MLFLRANHLFVKYYLFCAVLLLFTSSISHAQVDSMGINEALLQKKDSLPFPTTYQEVLKQHPYFNFFAAPVVREAMERRTFGKEPFFYLLSALVFLLAFVKTIYNKYFNNLVTVVFGASLKQKQLREQLMQSPLPSLLLNILFVLVMGIFISFILRQHTGGPYDADYWLQMLYCVAIVGAVYLGKFVVLKFTGWVFNIKEGTNVYLFVVFLVNKLIGIFFLPLIIILAFAPAGWWTVLFTISYILLAGFLLYRYIAAYGPVRREVKVSQFHFFMYLCAFEITPMILIYREFLKFI